MQLRILVCCLFIQSTSAFAQISLFPYSEGFDTIIAPNLPDGWSATGFSVSPSSPQSPPHCISVTGNTIIKQLTTQIINFTDKIPDKLTYYERRSNTAAGYRLEVRASIDGLNFDILLARFDTISTTTDYVQRILSLEKTGLQQQSNVRFRWQLLGDNTNTTGVLRIDDVLLTVATGFDVGLSRITCAPLSATRKDSLKLSITVKNYGTLLSSNFSIQLFCDDNMNGLCEPNENFAVLSGISLGAGDSLTKVFAHTPMKAGEHTFTVAIDFSPDENHANDTARMIVPVGSVKGDVLVNEIMYAPSGDEPEWVEVYNSSPDTINMKNWKISDSNVSMKSIITQADVPFPPGSFVVIAKDLLFTSYHPGIPFVVANFSALNNSTPDAVVLFDIKLNTIDSVMYAPSWGGQNGKSLERIDTEMPSTLQTNWGTSQDSLGSTPGRKNSIVRFDYDLMISNLTQIQTMVGGNAVPAVTISLRNNGRQTVDSVIFGFYNDSNRDSLPEPSELMQTMISVHSIAAGDSMVLSEPFPQLTSGVTPLIVSADWWRDEYIRNNRSFISITLSTEPRSIIINEIMYEPLSGQNEWLEFYNRSEQSIDLTHWTFSDKPTLSNANSFEIPTQRLAVKAGEYMVVAADSSIFTIPNSPAAGSGASCLYSESFRRI